METKLTILSIVQNSEDTWRKITVDDFVVTRLTGNSSQVFLLENSIGVSPKYLIFRFFGSADTLDLSSSSLITAKLSKHGLAPKILVETSEYRLEEYLCGYRNLKNSEIRDIQIAEKISIKLKIFHSLDFSDILDPESIVCIKNAEKWRKIAKTNLPESMNSRAEEVALAISALNKDYYKIFLDILPKTSPIVLSHMDTSYLNFLYQQEKKEVYLLDFDYTGYCYRAFDLAMLLTDIKYDYDSNEFPYFKVDTTSYNTDLLLASCVKAYGEGVEMFIECKQCMVAAHYLWAMWAFSLHNTSQDGLDMLTYGLCRFQEFISSYNQLISTSIETLRAESKSYFL